MSERAEAFRRQALQYERAASLKDYTLVDIDAGTDIINSARPGSRIARWRATIAAIRARRLQTATTRGAAGTRTHAARLGRARQAERLDALTRSKQTRGRTRRERSTDAQKTIGAQALLTSPINF